MSGCLRGSWLGWQKYFRPTCISSMGHHLFKFAYTYYRRHPHPHCTCKFCKNPHEITKIILNIKNTKRSRQFDTAMVIDTWYWTWVTFLNLFGIPAAPNCTYRYTLTWPFVVGLNYIVYVPNNPCSMHDSPATLFLCDYRESVLSFDRRIFQCVAREVCNGRQSCVLMNISITAGQFFRTKPLCPKRILNTQNN